MAICRLPAIFEVISVGSAVHLAVEFGVDCGARVLVKWRGLVLNPGAHEQSTRGLVSLKHRPSVVGIVVVMVPQTHQNN